MSRRHWHVLGAGAMGCLFARALHEAGGKVTLLLRSEPERDTGSVKVEEGEDTVVFAVGLSSVAEPAPIHHLLVATKAQDLAGALASVGHRLGEESQVLLAANGMGLLQEAREVAAKAELYCCTSTEGAYRLGERHIRHAGRGTTLFGRPGGGGTPDWMSDWLTGPLDCRWEADIEAALWHKLAINCAINPLTAIHRCRNGRLGTDPELRAQVQILCDEIAMVSRGAGFTRTAETIHRDALEVIEKTAANTSSMLQDVVAGRPTEIDYITGYLLRTAQDLGLSATSNRDIRKRVQDIQGTNAI